MTCLRPILTRLAPFIAGLVLVLSCGDKATRESALDFPAQGASGKEDAFGRKLLGVAAPYAADPTLTGREVVLKSDMAARREAGWAIAQRVLESVPLLGLADGSAAAPTTTLPNVPRWQTWYGVEDFKRMFVELYKRLGPLGRSERTPFSAADLDAVEAWNAAALDRSNRWPLERYLEHVAALGVCPEGTPADECARLQQSQFSGGAAGNARITYSPATVRHLLENYGAIVDCLEGLGALPLDAAPAEGNFTYCFEREFPVDAVLIKAQWVRSDFGRKLPAFDTDAAALAKVIAATQSADWGTGATTPDAVVGDRLADPKSSAIYTTRMKNGDTYRLAALHIMTKELRHWTWVTLWWSDRPDSDFGEDRPEAFGMLDPVWSNYKMCVVVDYTEGDADPGARFPDHPSLAAAIAVPSAGAGAPSWCSNPYIEHGRGNARTNCIGCHQHGGSLAGQDLDADGRPDPFVLERVIDSENLFPNNGRTQIRSVFPTDYLWSPLRVDDLAHVMSHEVTTFDQLDKNDPDIRALRVLELTGDAARGGEIFASSCARCHGPEGRGTIDGPSLHERVPTLSDPQIARTLITGKNNRMPAWGSRLDDQALADLVAHLKATFAAP